MVMVVVLLLGGCNPISNCSMKMEDGVVRIAVWRLEQRHTLEVPKYLFVEGQLGPICELCKCYLGLLRVTDPGMSIMPDFQLPCMDHFTWGKLEHLEQDLNCADGSDVCLLQRVHSNQQSPILRLHDIQIEPVRL